jgi:hypothetical protein
LLVLVVTDRSDAVVRDSARVFALGLAFLLVVVPAALLLARSRGASRGLVAGGFVVLVLMIASIGYPIQRDYLRDRFAAGSDIPGLGLDSAYQRSRDVEDARIGLAGTTAGFLQYGFYGTDLSNRVIYLGEKGPHAAFNAIPTCAAFRTAVNEADLDYLVTSPFLNFLHPDDPIPSPEASWLRGEKAATPIQRNGEITVWRLHGKLNPNACGSNNAPLNRVPNTPKDQSQ